MKKVITIFLSAALIAGAIPYIPAAAETADSGAAISFATQKALYAHAAHSSSDKEAWVAWQCAHDDELVEVDKNTKYFFLPSSIQDNTVDIYNAGDSAVTLNGTQIASGETAAVSFETGARYSVDFGGSSVTVEFLCSSAEAAIYVNNTNADGNGSELIEYLSQDKSRTAAATGAIVDKNGTIDNTPIKKIKGRGNTTWDKSKKPFNITYNDKVSIAGMNKSKKFSMLANYQDDSLSRNRFLYDLSDAVGLPYASDSRYVDFYVNGYYWGSYQATEKIEVGSSNVVSDIDEKDYLNKDGTIKEDFAFVCEVDPSANSDDYTVKCSNNINVTIKSPELSPGDAGYEEVKNYVKSKFNAFAYACANPDNRELSKYGDVESLTKLYLINELGKNWDAGAASLYLTYKQDANGEYKFFGSPVWDYDNSLGNAVGVEGDLRSFKVTDYTKYTGWWCRYKNRRNGTSTSTNIMSNLALNDYILSEAPRIWFEDFVPALRHFSGEQYSETIDKEFMTASEYLDLIQGSAEMNYKSGWLLNTGAWIADHSKLDIAHFNYESGTYYTEPQTVAYLQSFGGMYQYCTDWMTSRAAWLSSQMYDDYASKAAHGIYGDVNNDKVIDADDALLILRHSLKIETIPEAFLPLGDVNSDGDINSSDALAVLRSSVGLKDAGILAGQEI